MPERIPPGMPKGRLPLVQQPLTVNVCDAVNRLPARVILGEIAVDMSLHARERGNQCGRGREAEQMNLGGIKVAEHALERRASHIAPQPLDSALAPVSRRLPGDAQMRVDRAEEVAP